MKKFFKFDELRTGYKQEIIGGATTFATMSYIVVVNPKILEAAGIPLGPSMVATILTAFFGTLAMGIYARRPFAIAPYMGENAFIAFTVVQILGYSWQTALGAIFIGGVLFTLISILGIRTWLANAIPESLQISFAAGIGLFLTFIGLNVTGIVVLGAEGAPVHVGDLTAPTVIIAVAGFLLISFLMIRRITAAILIGIVLMTLVAMVSKVAPLPEEVMSLPPSLSPVFMELDIKGAMQWGFFSVILTVFVMDFVDTTGSLLGLGYKAGLLDEKGNLPEIEKPMLCDSLSTVIASLVGTTTAGIYIESAAGMESGAKSGFASVVTALLFLLTLFFAPFLTAIPACAYGPALLLVGLLMMSPIKKLNFDDLTESLPAFAVIILMSFTYNLGIGITAGFVTYVLVKVFAGQTHVIKPALWILAALSALFFVFYPY